MPPTACARRGAGVRHTRRAVLGYGLGAAALWGLRPLNNLAAREARAPSPAEWRTWLLASADELRPTRPGRSTQTEVDELLRLQAQRTTMMTDAVALWDTGPAVLPWTNLALELITSHRP